MTDGGDIPVTATEDSVILTFAINPDAPITQQGTTGGRNTADSAVGECFQGL